MRPGYEPEPDGVVDAAADSGFLLDSRFLMRYTRDCLLVHQAPPGDPTDRRIVYANEPLCDLLGVVSEKELLGRPILDFAHPESVEAIRVPITAKRLGSFVAPREAILLRADGTAFRAEIVTQGMSGEREDRPSMNEVGRSSRLVERREIQWVLLRASLASARPATQPTPATRPTVAAVTAGPNSTVSASSA